MRRPSARGRTWTLAELDRTGVYRLWFDPNEMRWEVRPLDAAEGTIVTPRASRRVAPPVEFVAAPAVGGG